MHVYNTGSIVKNMYYYVMGKTEYGLYIISSIAQQRPSTIYLLTKNIAQHVVKYCPTVSLCSGPNKSLESPPSQCSSSY